VWIVKDSATTRQIILAIVVKHHYCISVMNTESHYDIESPAGHMINLHSARFNAADWFSLAVILGGTGFLLSMLVTAIAAL